MAEVSDPRAVPMIWAVFVPKGAEGQQAAVRLLAPCGLAGRIAGTGPPGAHEPGPRVRQEAAQLLRRRDARDFAPLLIGLIRDPIRYEVKPVRGPGKAGELVIKDGSTNRQRLYTPLNSPDIPMKPGDSITMGEDGLPVLSQFTGTYALQSPNAAFTAAMLFGLTPPANAGHIADMFRHSGLSAAQSQRLGQSMGSNGNSAYQQQLVLFSGLLPSPSVRMNLEFGQYLQTPVGQMELDAQRSAQVASQQLAGDVKAIESYNAPILETNRRVRQLLAESVGTDKGDDHSEWVKWMVDLFGLAYSPQKASTEQTTIIEQVPVDYQPQANPPVVQQALIGVRPSHSCFGAGTLVRTMDGPARDRRPPRRRRSAHPGPQDRRVEVSAARGRLPQSARMATLPDRDRWRVDRRHRHPPALEGRQGLDHGPRVEAGRYPPHPRWHRHGEVGR